MSRTTALVWLRRDLRLTDHPALAAALNAHDQVIPVYVHAPEEEAPWAPGAAARWWQHHSLAALALSLAERGSRLTLARGPSAPALLALCRETGASTVYWSAATEAIPAGRDTTVATALQEAGVEARAVAGALLWEPQAVQRADGGPYRVFGAWWRAAQRLPVPAPVPAPRSLKPPSRWPASLQLEALNLAPDHPWAQGLAAGWQPGEAGALRAIDAFLATALHGYDSGRDRPDLPATSRLSPHLHWGEISPRQLWAAAGLACAGDAADAPGPAAWLRQLGWRDFAHQLLWHYPHSARQPLRPEFMDYPWRADPQPLLRAWQRGRTGIPLVDAGMRQLWQSGWMHNRVRMVTASWLTKNARIPWQAGAAWFWDTLVDADLANNTMGWQWVAGCGTDAAPYFRIFNPVTQGRQHDAAGDYVRRWVPELGALPARWIHAPWEAPAAVLRDAGVRLGADYPLPVLDLARSRQEALDGLKRMRG